MAEPWQHEQTIAMKAVRTAGRVCQEVRRHMVSSDTLQKKDRSPVTVADFASQAVVAAQLHGAFPADAIVGEEQTDQLRQAGQEAIRAAVVEHASAVLDEANHNQASILDLIDHGGGSAAPGCRFWTLDPIDGTKGFLRSEQYAIALALIEDGQIILGALGCPNLSISDEVDGPGGTGILLVATRGRGTTLYPLDDKGDREGDPGASVRVNEEADLSMARFCESVESGHSNQDHAAQIAAILGIRADPVRMDSQAKYATVARGRAEIYLRLPTSADYREKIWDHAAGTVIVTEAGGRVSDIHGLPLDFTCGRQLEANQGIVATNGPIHDAVLRAIKRVLG